MTEDELQEIRNTVVDACQDVIDNYDWDKAFQRFMDGK